MSQPEAPRSYKVLVVEDEGLIAHDIAARLGTLGHEALGPVSTAEEAIALAPAADIVLMDIRIDGERDGIQAALDIRARHHLPVVFVTAHADRATLERAKQAGPFGYIVKPLAPTSLQAGLEMAIAQHRLERLLEEREAWLRSAIACAADAVAVTSAQGRVRLLNRSAEHLTGWTQSEAEGQPVEKIIRLLDADSNNEDHAGIVALALLRDAPVDLDPRCRLVSRDGREMEIEGAAAPVRLGEETLGAVLTFRDATARRWEERQIRQAQRLEAAARLAAAAANDYTTLIALIRSQTERLLRQFGELAAARSGLDEIHQAATAADQITRRLGALGARQVGQPEVLSLNGVLRRMARLMEAAAGHRVRVAIRPSPGIGRIWADLAQMESAIMSLVMHACAAMPEGGQMLIETARVDLPHPGRTVAYVLLSVTYSAMEPDIDRLFDPASTADAGMALAMAHSAAAECGGYLSARPGPNGGSRIELLIPRLSDQVLLAGPEKTRGIPTILFVDQSDPVRADLHNFFEAAGFNLLEAADVREAVTLGDLHEGALALVIAESPQADAILERLRPAHPSLGALRIGEQTEGGPAEIRRPFTRQALLDKVSALLGPKSQAEACATP